MMDFVLDSKEQAIEAAKNAEYTGGNYVKVHGAYYGPIQSCVFKKFPSGAGGMEIVIKTEEGLLCKGMLITMTKDGKSTYKNSKGEEFPMPGINMIRGGLMPILQQRELKSVQKDKDDIEYPSVIGKNIGMLVDIVKTYAKDKKTDKIDTSKIYENTDLKGFFCPVTGKTGSEILEGKPAEKKAKIEANLKTVEPELPKDSEKANSKSDPFGDMSSSQDDPFSQGAESSSNTEDKKDPFADNEEKGANTVEGNNTTETEKQTDEKKSDNNSSSGADGGDFWN